MTAMAKFMGAKSHFEALAIKPSVFVKIVKNRFRQSRLLQNLYLSFRRSYRFALGLKMTAICKFICALITLLSSTTFRFCVNREKPFSAIAIVAKFVTQLPMVIQTCSWAQNDHNIMQVYLHALLTSLGGEPTPIFLEK